MGPKFECEPPGLLPLSHPGVAPLLLGAASTAERAGRGLDHVRRARAQPGTSVTGLLPFLADGHHIWEMEAKTDRELCKPVSAVQVRGARGARGSCPRHAAAPYQEAASRRDRETAGGTEMTVPHSLEPEFLGGRRDKARVASRTPHGLEASPAV